MSEASEFVTRNEFETRMNYHEKILDERTMAIQAMMDKNLAELKLVVSDMRGDINALAAKVDAIQMKFGWYLVLFGVAVSVALFLAQKIF